jgi:hypothetical protein
MRRLLNQAANAAVKSKGTIFEILYRRYVPRLGHHQTIGVIAHLLPDRDRVYGQPLRHRLKGLEIEEVLTAPQSPWQNPFVERLIGSIRLVWVGLARVWTRLEAGSGHRVARWLPAQRPSQAIIDDQPSSTHLCDPPRCASG